MKRIKPRRLTRQEKEWGTKWMNTEICTTGT